jgi:hypothetical protein
MGRVPADGLDRPIVSARGVVQREGATMYIGVGTVVVILAIIIVFMLLRRRGV